MDCLEEGRDKHAIKETHLLHLPTEGKTSCACCFPACFRAVEGRKEAQEEPDFVKKRWPREPTTELPGGGPSSFSLSQRRVVEKPESALQRVDGCLCGWLPLQPPPYQRRAGNGFLLTQPPLYLPEAAAAAAAGGRQAASHASSSLSRRPLPPGTLVEEPGHITLRFRPDFGAPSLAWHVPWETFRSSPGISVAAIPNTLSRK